MKLLSICPTRNRPELLKQMLESYRLTKTVDAEMFVYVSEDDPRLNDYREVFNIFGVKNIIAERRSVVKVLNYVSTELYPGIEYYQEVNDDHIYRTRGWDKAFINKIEQAGKGWGIACGNDLMPEPWGIARHPSAAVISGNIVRTLGCFVLPAFDILYIDTYLRDIAEGINALYRMPEIVIEHFHWLNGRRKKDKNYDAVYAREMYSKFTPIYFNWAKYQRAQDIKKLKEARDVRL